MSFFPSQPSKPDFWAIQQAVLEYWHQTKAFEVSVEKNPADNPYRFYDGPPFITGTPHYGSLLSSICKDVIPRYQTMKGKRVERVWGRDCHGLPIEQKVQAKLGWNTSKEIEKKGVDTFIAECYTYTKETSHERPFYIKNIGRWVDYDNCYKTMDNDYMESVMRVFKQLWDKGLVYKGKRVSMFSTALSTPISSFEVAMDDTYNEINDPAITVKFEIVDPKFWGDGIVKENAVYALARTTTPRTIPANLGLAVSEDVLYSTISYNDAYYVVATKRVEKIFAGKQYSVVGSPYHGSLLVGLSYKPPYDYFVGHNDNNHRIYSADFVSDEDGTGIVHIAPEFGESDFHLGKTYGLTQTEALDDEGRYTSQITDKVGVFYRDANELICTELKDKGLLFDKGSITHRVAFCPRSNTPLIFKAQDSRFINIQKLKPNLLKANEAINRYPSHFKDGRFAKTIEQAPDRCISRTRFWGTPMPIYVPKRKANIRDTSLQKGEIHFLRHGLADKSIDDGPLTEEGIRQITDLAHTMKAQGHPYTEILTSSMKRAVQTAEIVSEILDIPMRIDERFGSLQRKKALHQAKKATMHKFGIKNMDGLTTMGLKNCNEEQLLDVLGPSIERDRETLADLRKNHNPSALVVSHGEVIQSFAYCINGGSITQTFAHMPEWGTITSMSLFPSYRIASSRDDIFRANKPYKQLTKIILMRHGRTDYNEKHWGDAEGKGRLTDYGHKQAQAMADKYGKVDIDAIYCSPLIRCQQTIGYLADKLHKEIIIDKRLTECQAFAVQDKPFDCSTIQRGHNKPIDGVSGESIEDVYTRVKEFLYEKIDKHAGQTIVICSHGDPLIMMRKVLADFDYNTEKKKYYIHNKNTMDISVVEYVDVARKARFDLHRPSIDQIRVMIEGHEYERIPEVLDVWMDSASMPYAQVHYPFENKEKFEAQFPADYIVEYTGQIRAWFYVMHVLAVALFDRPSYRNVLCTGVMKGNDGRKMSKSYGNFPDPKKALMQYGGDAIRMHSLLSPVVYGGDVEVKEEGFLEVVKTVMLPMRHAFNFFITYANIDGWQPSIDRSDESIIRSEPLAGGGSFLDSRIISHLHSLIQTVDINLSQYTMHTASRAIVGFLDNLTNRYIRRSRRRFWKSESDQDKLSAYETLYTVLMTLSKIIAPFMPFLAEHMYRALGGEGSVHHQSFPVADEKQILTDVMASMDRVSKLVNAGLGRRARHNLRVRQPLASATISEKLDDELLEIVKDELNVKIISVDPALTKSVQTIIKPDGKILGKKLGSAFKNVLTKAKNGEFTRGKDGTVIVDGHILEREEFEIAYRSHDETFDGEIVEGMVVVMDPVLTKELEYEGYARDLIRIIQEARKTADYQLTDRIVLFIEGDNHVVELIEMFGGLISEETLSEFGELDRYDQEGEEVLGPMVVRWKIGKE